MDDCDIRTRCGATKAVGVIPPIGQAQDEPPQYASSLNSQSMASLAGRSNTKSSLAINGWKPVRSERKSVPCGTTICSASSVLLVMARRSDLLPKPIPFRCVSWIRPWFQR